MSPSSPGPIRLFALGALAAACLLGVACGRLADEPSWLDQLQPDSPCYRVDLLDGLDASSTTELHDLFGCLDHQGHFASLRAADASLDWDTRAGDPAGVELARLVNHLPEVEVDPMALAGILLDALRAEDRPVDELLDLSLELIYGDRANRVRAGTVRLDDPAALQDGVVAPLRTVLPIAASTLLDDTTGAAVFAGELLQDPETARWIRTVSSVIETPDPEVQSSLQPLVVHLGQAIGRARSPQDDRWPGASGDSLRDLADFFVVQDNPVVDQISPAIDAMLGDARVRDALVPTFDELERGGHLAPLGRQVDWLATVDTDGTVALPGEPSALFRFVRLLADSNHPIDCQIDLFVTTLDWSFGNLAVSTLELIADLSPGTVQTLAGLITSLTGSSISDPLLDLAVDSGICPDLTRQTLDDLQALEAIQQPEAVDLLTAFIELLHVLERGETNHIPAFADLAERLYRAGGLEPAEEAIRDLGDQPVVDDVLALLPLLLHPEDHGISAGAEPANDVQDLIEIARWSFAVDPETGLTGWQVTRPLLAPALAQDDTWRVVGNLGDLMADDGSQTSQALDLVPRLLALDPDLELLHQLGPLLADPTLSEPLLRVVETRAVADALLADTPVAPETEVPLAFYGRLVTTGALEDLLGLVDRVLDTLAPEG